jgi:hypothetical protein
LDQRATGKALPSGRPRSFPYNPFPAVPGRLFAGGAAMRTHHPKHPTTAFWHAALVASAMIAVWLLLTTLLPAPPHRPVTTEDAMTVHAAALRSVNPDLENA